MSRHAKQRLHAHQTWCSGPMMAVFDAALDGEPAAVQAALNVCQSCPMLDACRQDWERKPAKHRWGVQAGVYTPAELPQLMLQPEAPAAPSAPPTQPVRDVVEVEAVAPCGVHAMTTQDELPFLWGEGANDRQLAAAAA